MRPLPIRNPFPGAVSLLEERLGSTQDEARRLCGPGFPSGSVLAAEEQEGGRGRFPERRWESPSGLNLLFTVFLGPESVCLPSGLPLTGLPLRIGAALCSTAEAYARLSGLAFPDPVRLKWPNDLLVGERKIAGILCEAGPHGLLAGVGLNCNQRLFSPDLAASATSLALELGAEVDRWRLLELFLEELQSALADAALAEAALGDTAWRPRVEALLWRRGEIAAFSPGREASKPGLPQDALAGKIEGIDEEGSLLFKVEGETEARAFAAGELLRAFAGNLLTARPPAL
jgi:BirA family biotin operon repressor/biotin-[acetyl-CoA-carboxylase] ligase